MTMKCSRSMFGFSLIKVKITSNAKMKKQVEIGSSCLITLSSLKYGVVLPSLIIHDSAFLSKVFIHFINSLSNRTYFKTYNKKEWFIEAKFFLMSILNI